jgi:DnaJ-class molecular chaperone
MSLLYDANKHDIKKGFRGLANKYHPDKGGDVNG